jgi:hypothetical protein
LNILLLQLLAEKSRTAQIFETCLKGILRGPAPGVKKFPHLIELLISEAVVAILVKKVDSFNEIGIAQVTIDLNLLRGHDSVVVPVEEIERLVGMITQNCGSFGGLGGMRLAGPSEQGCNFKSR